MEKPRAFLCYNRLVNPFVVSFSEMTNLSNIQSNTKRAGGLTREYSFEKTKQSCVLWSPANIQIIYYLNSYLESKGLVKIHSEPLSNHFADLLHN